MLVAGVDEVHYGCIFGPVYAAAVIVPQKFHAALAREGVRDSKQIMKESERRHLARLIQESCICGISYCTVLEMQQMGWKKATDEAMRRALAALGRKPDLLQVDGITPLQGYSGRQKAIVGGDQTILEISAASIIAKVAADDAVVAMAEKYPYYDLERNKGYFSPAHQRGIEKHGMSPEHRNYRIRKAA